MSRSYHLPLEQAETAMLPTRGRLVQRRAALEEELLDALASNDAERVSLVSSRLRGESRPPEWGR